MVSRLFEFNDWNEIARTLKLYLNAEVIINPLFVHKALIKVDQRKLEELMVQPHKWFELGKFHIKFEKWNRFTHSRPSLMKDYGGWISIKNLPLDYWSSKTFEAIGAYFGGLESISSETLNLINVAEAKIKVKRNLC